MENDVIGPDLRSALEALRTARVTRAGRGGGDVLHSVPTTTQRNRDRNAKRRQSLRRACNYPTKRGKRKPANLVRRCNGEGKRVGFEDHALTPSQDQEEAEAVRVLQATVEGLRAVTSQCLKSLEKGTSRKSSSPQRDPSLTHGRGEGPGDQRVPYMPLEDVLATQGDRPHKRRLRTQEPIRDVLILCEAREPHGRAPRRNMADSA